MQEMQPVLCRVRFLVVSFVMILLVTASSPTYANVNDARMLQDRAIARIDRYIDHFRRTSDQQALRDELTQAARELERSIELFRAGSARADAARSMVKLGDIQRYLSDWDSAIRIYEQAAREELY